MATEQVEFTIDMDRECSKCGKKGAGPRGLCLQCVKDFAVPLRSAQLLAELMQSQVDKLIWQYAQEINFALEKQQIMSRPDPGPLLVRFDVALVKGAKTFVESCVTWTLQEKHKHGVPAESIDPNQPELPGIGETDETDQTDEADPENPFKGEEDGAAPPPPPPPEWQKEARRRRKKEGKAKG